MATVRYRTHDVITTVGYVWDSQHGNQSGTAKSDVRIDSTVREEIAAQARQVRPPLLSHTILTRETGTRIHPYYFEKIPKNETSVLRTESKETPDLDQHRMQQELTQNNPRSLSNTEYEIARVRGDTTPPTLSTRIFMHVSTTAVDIGYICPYLTAA